MNNVLLYAITVLVWGSTWLAITFQIGEVSPLVSLFYRFALASASLFMFLWGTGKIKTITFTRKQHMFIALQGMSLFSLNYLFVYEATHHLTSGLVAVLFSVISLMNAFNQAVFFKIPLKAQVLLGNLTGLVGVAIIFWPEITTHHVDENLLIGIGYGLFAAYLASLGNMASLRNTRDSMPVLETNAVGMAYGAVCSLVFVVVTGAPIHYEMTVSYTASLIYLAVFGSAIAFAAYLTLLKNIGADKAAYATILFPIVALGLSTIFEGYHWTPEAIVGLGLAIIGNVVAMAKRENLLHWRMRMAKKIIK